MEKPDYTDISKFEVSIGILLFALAGLFYWFSLTTNDIYMIKQDDISKLSSLAAETIIQKQQHFAWIYHNNICISIIIALPGLVFIVTGLLGWKKRQLISDQIQEKELRKRENELKDLTKDERTETIKKEIIENEGIEPDIEIENEANRVQAYSEIENSIISQYIDKYKFEYEIHTKFKYKEEEFDVLLIPKYFGQTVTIVEIKYYTKEIIYSYLMSGIRKFLLSIKILNEYFGERNTYVDNPKLILFLDL